MYHLKNVDVKGLVPINSFEGNKKINNFLIPLFMDVINLDINSLPN